MNIALVHDNIEHQNTTAMLLDEAGYSVEQTFSLNSPWVQPIKQDTPDALVISIDQPTSDLLHQLQYFRNHPFCPVIVLAHKGDADIIQTTIQSGADSCIIGDINCKRLQTILEIANARFKVNQQLVNEITELKDEIKSLEDRLSDRKDIDQAKGLLMTSYKMTEADAYKALRQMAMDTGNKLGEVARNLISMSKVLS